VARGRRKFSRPLGQRRYRKLFVIAVEGAKTEPSYFANFQNQNSVFRVKCLRAKSDSSPEQVLKRMLVFLDQQKLQARDEAWVVVDRDAWEEEQLRRLLEWARSAPNFGLALSNPKFEYWLLLHFEDAIGVSSARDCSTRLERYLPGYDKGVPVRAISPEQIASAIERARRRDTPPCPDWPRSAGSTVYRLVEHIIASGSDQ
jgi:hypothetical protein